MNPRLALVALVLGMAATAAFLLSDRSGGPADRAEAADRTPIEEAASRPKVELERAGGAAASSEGRGVDRTSVAAAPELLAEDQAQSTAPSAEPARLAGRVVDEAGRPIAEAELLLQSGMAPMFAAGGPRPKRLGETDSDGSFALDARSSGEGRLIVRADGYVVLTRPVALVPGASTDLGDLVIELGCVLEGRVETSRGLPVANAQLRVLGSQGGFFLGSAPERPEDGVTDASGRFRLAHMTPGPWRVRVEHEEHPEAIFEGATEAAGERASGLVWKLEAGTELAGRVLGWEGEPDLEVACFDPEPPTTGSHGLQLMGRRELRRVDVDPDGSFLVTGLPLDRQLELELYELEPIDASDLSFTVSGGRSASTQPVSARSGDAGVTLFFQAGAALALRVVDARTGAPVERFQLAFGPNFALEALQADEGPPHADGRARFGNVRQPNELWFSGEPKALLEAKGYASLELDLPDLSAGGEFDLGTVRMQPVPQVTVRVTDLESGAPIEGARVELAPAAEDTDEFVSVRRRIEVGDEGGELVEIDGAGRSAALTNEDGVAVVDSRPGELVDITARHGDHADGKLAAVRLPAAQDVEYALELGRGGTVTITVLDPKGAPLAGWPVERRSPAGEFVSANRVVSDSGGIARFDQLPAGPEAFRLGKPGSRAAEGAFLVSAQAVNEDSWTRVEVEEGGLHALTLQAQPSFGVHGRITEAGRPLVGARVKAVTRAAAEDPFGGGGMIDMGGGGERTDAEGRYRLEGLEPDEYRLEVSHESRALPEFIAFQVVNGDERVDVDLSQNALEGRVTGSDDKPLAGVSVSAVRVSGTGNRSRMIFFSVDTGGGASGGVFDGSSGGKVLTDEDGRYRLTGLPADTELRVVADPTAAHSFHTSARSDPVTVGRDETQRGVDVTCPEGGAIRVLLDFGADDPSPVLVFARPASGEPRTKMVQSSEEVTFEGLEPGTWTVSANRLGSSISIGGPGGMELEVLPGEIAETTLAP